LLSVFDYPAIRKLNAKKAPPANAEGDKFLFFWTGEILLEPLFD
jgi:hypothetical protein